MILSQASDLKTRERRWVARKNDDGKFNRLTTDYGQSTVTWASAWGPENGVVPQQHPCPVSGWVSQQG